MNKPISKMKAADFEKVGYETMLKCYDPEEAARSCAPLLHAYELVLQSSTRRLKAEIVELKSRAEALHSHLYNRPDPVSDAQMLSHALKCRILIGLAVIAALACFVGNFTTFYLLGFGLVLTFVSAAAMTALPSVVGHLAYEWIIHTRRWVQVLIVLVAVSLVGCGVLMIGQARTDMVNRATAVQRTNSYVEGADEENSQPVPEPKAQNSESKIHETLGEGMLLVMIAAELLLMFIIGLLIQMLTDDDPTAWRKLKKINLSIIDLDERVAELAVLPELAKKYCAAGILRAQNGRSRRHPPYHRAITPVLIMIVLLALPARAQTITRYEGILIDTSKSISRKGQSNELFHEYVLGVKKLLLAEPPNSRVWVLTISADSFGGTREILSGWTPDVHGVFTDDLSRARWQMASKFEQETLDIVPSAAGTDILGALWRLKTLFDSYDHVQSDSIQKTIWIFSDMVNETKAFPMTKLIQSNSANVLKIATARGLVVPLKGYEIYACGASTIGSRAQDWVMIREFWRRYFWLGGAKLIVYSNQPEVF